jgi:glycosyltransferase involved in cell wall biosynthesis
VTATPGVTVLLPVRDGMPHLPAAVESVLSQSYPDLELLVIDDGSSDGSGSYLDSLADPRVTVVHQANVGLVESLNRGLARSKHELVARMDADDISHRDRLSQQVAALEAQPDAVAVACCYTIVDEADQPVSQQHVPLSAAYTERQLYFRDAWAHGSILLRRSAVLEAGGYRDVGPCEDYDLWLRLLDRGSLVGVCAPPLFTYRITGSGVSATASVRQDECRRAVRDTFDHVGLAVVLWRQRRRVAALRCAAGAALLALRHPSALAVLPPLARTVRRLRRRPMTAEEIRLATGRG